MTIAQAVRDAMLEEMDGNDRVIVLGEDVGVDGGVFRATEGLIERFGPERVIDTPLAESAIIGMSVGLAATGFRPIAEIQFMGFVYPAINQLFGHAARMRNRTRGRLSCPMVVRMPYGGGIHPPEHHSESYEALFLNTPGFKVVVPSNPYDAKGLLVSAIRDDDPVLFMEPKRIYRAFREAVPAESYTVPLGKADIAREGTDVTLIAWGAMVRVCLDASEVLARNEISAEVVDLAHPQPARSRDDDRECGQDRACRGCPRGGAHRRVWGRDRGPDQRTRAAPARGTGAAGHRFRRVFPLAQNEKHYLPSRQRSSRRSKRPSPSDPLSARFGYHMGRIANQ